MNAPSYIMLLTLFLTEGGTLEAEQDTTATSMEECREEARRQSAALREEFALTTRERGLCPFRDVKIRCERRKHPRQEP